MPKSSDLWIAPLGEGGLVLAVALAGWATGQALIFASLGPTAYEIIEQPNKQSARPYNVIVGHLAGVLCGFLALWITGAWGAPAAGAAAGLPWVRVGAAVIACVWTAWTVLILGAGQPAALSTTLLVSLGAIQTGRGAVDIMAAVTLIAALGEPIRRMRLKQQAAG